MLLAWVTFPAGGVYPWVWVPAACGVAVLAMVARSANARDERARFTDAALALSACALLLQLVPMPSALLHALDPNVMPIRAEGANTCARQRKIFDDAPCTAVAVYQTAEPGYAIGQAHNHYLQLVAEGDA